MPDALKPGDAGYVEPTVVIPSVVDDGSPEGHVAKMLAMGIAPEKKPGEDGYVAPTRPESIPEQFWDAEKGVVNTEALLKSQADGQAEISKLRDGKKPETPEEIAAAEKAAAEKAAADLAAGTGDQTKAVTDASAEWAEKGELSETTYKSLETVGLSKGMVDEYIAGQQAIVGNLQAAAFDPFEGKEGYEKAANWAAEKLTEDEIKALDVQLTSTNPAIVAQGAKALAARYAAEADKEPDAIRGNNNTTTGGSYASSREMMKDMNSAKYRTSQAFRDEVAGKLSRSNI